jgi:hypothetical protein
MEGPGKEQEGGSPMSRVSYPPTPNEEDLPKRNCSIGPSTFFNYLHFHQFTKDCSLEFSTIHC